jgi:hypothetical protein
MKPLAPRLIAMAIAQKGAILERRWFYQLFPPLGEPVRQGSPEIRLSDFGAAI